jgi:hypothetical protein
MAIDATVAVEIAQIRRDHFCIAGVITFYSNRDFTLVSGIGESLCSRISDIDSPLIVAPDMRAYLIKADEDLGFLTGSVEVDKGTSPRVGVGHLEMGAIPSGALVVTDIGINGITTIEAMWEGYLLPLHVVSGFIATPDLPDAPQGTLIVLPALVEGLTVLGL